MYSYSFPHHEEVLGE